MSEGKLRVTDSRTSKEYEIPIHRNTISASSFKAIKAPGSTGLASDLVENGLRLFDPGLKNTAVSESQITFIDGKRGRLQFRGHRVEDVWYDAEYEDFLFLFVWERFPLPDEKSCIRRDLAAAAEKIPKGVFDTIRSFPKTATQMQMVIAGMAAYLGSNPSMIPTHSGRNIYRGNTKAIDEAIIPSLAALAVCIGVAASHHNSTPFTSMDPSQGFLYNILLMMGKVDKATGKPDPNHVLALQRITALGADNGHTNSTSAVLLAASTLSDPISCLICALSSGYGPLHFGAMEVVYKVMASVGKPENVPALIEKVKRGEARLFGYGHRLYEVEDPRLRFAKQILQEIGTSHPLIEVAMEIDRVASSDQYFVQRNLHATVDLYAVFIFIALEFEPGLIPVMMMASRSAGFMAHWKEAMLGQNQLWRPPNFYTGELNVDGPLKASL